MEGLSNQADQLEGHSAGLRDAVDNGKLVMDPQAAERVAQVYEDKADELRRKRQRTDQMLADDVFGDCQIGKQLEQKFTEKVNDGKSGVVAILGKMENILNEMAQAYRDSARDMENTDDESARSLGRPGV